MADDPKTQLNSSTSVEPRLPGKLDLKPQHLQGRRRHSSPSKISRAKGFKINRRAHVFVPDQERLCQRGFSRIKNVPALFDGAFCYLREHNLYLRERACLDWHPSDQHSDCLLSTDYPRATTLLKTAYNLSNLIGWCEDRRRDWRYLSYDDILTYQQEQIDGRWSFDGRSLSPATANRRADEATLFLSWAAKRGLRGPFTVRRISKHIAIRSGESSRMSLRQVKVRPGRAKGSMIDDVGADADLPSPVEIRDWLLRVLERRGYAKQLACRFILETGVRRMELVSLTVSQLPKAENLEALSQRGKTVATMKLTTTKGGRPRTISMALAFAQELRRWVDTKRLALLVRYKRRVGRYPDEEERERLFLSDAIGHEGTPIQAQTIYRVFSEVRPGPAKWHPHFARHAFACFWILHALEDQAKASGRALRNLGPDWIALQSQYWLGMLRRQLGHVDEKTTHLYLRWLQTAVGIADLANGWHRFLSEPACSSEAGR